jgi:hypothetical protein
MKYVSLVIMLLINAVVFSQEIAGPIIPNGTYTIEPGTFIVINDNEISIDNDVTLWLGYIKGTYHTYSKDNYNYMEIDASDGNKYYFSYSVIEDILFLYSMIDGKCISASIFPVKGQFTRLINYYHFESSSYLVEFLGDREYRYPPENLSVIDRLNPPWAEGVKGDGIGEWIGFYYTEESRSFYIFNGYFDPKYTHLFTRNNRIKRIRVEGYSDSNKTKETFKYSQEFTLEDTPQIQKIEIPVGYHHFKMVILDVYKGTHYEDTCLSGVYTDARWGM